MTIKEIANLASVSTATVSRVINGKNDVSEHTRETIQRLIHENSFKPKVSVVSQNDNIGVFISDNRTQLSNPYTTIIMSGIADELFKSEVLVTLIPSNKISRNSKEFSIFCAQRRISGCLFLSSTLDDTYICDLSERVPIVLIGNDLGNSDVGSVRSDNYEGAYNATQYLIGLGHRNILLVMASPQFIDHRDRLHGAEKALADSGIERHPYDILNSQSLSDSDLNYALSHAFDVNRPEAIFVGGDQDAIRVIRILSAKGYHIPHDVSVIGYDNLPFSANINPPLTTVNQPIYEIGREAAKMVLTIVWDPDFRPRSLILKDNNIMIRESTRRQQIDS